MKYLLLYLALFFIIGCKNNNSSDYHISHTNDTISLSLYGINLGDSVNRVYETFPSAYDVGLDNISYYLPLIKDMGDIYKEMGISIIAVDTTFIIDHRSRKNSYTHNCVHFEFPYDYTEHPAILSFFIQYGHVLQTELFVGLPFGKPYGDYFPDHECGPTVLDMYTRQYGECDSLLFVSEKNDKSITLGVNEASEVIDKAKKDVGYNYTTASIWQWKNAQILVQDKFKHRIIDNHINFWTIIRILYTDITAVNRESQRKENARIEEEKRIEDEKNMYQRFLEESLNKQDM